MISPYWPITSFVISLPCKERIAADLPRKRCGGSLIIPGRVTCVNWRTVLSMAWCWCERAGTSTFRICLQRFVRKPLPLPRHQGAPSSIQRGRSLGRLYRNAGGTRSGPQSAWESAAAPFMTSSRNIRSKNPPDTRISYPTPFVRSRRSICPIIAGEGEASSKLFRKWEEIGGSMLSNLSYDQGGCPDSGHMQVPFIIIKKWPSSSAVRNSYRNGVFPCLSVPAL